MRIWLDADATPRDVKDIVFRAAHRLSIETVVVANQRVPLPPGHPTITAVRVEGGPNVADRHIATNASPGDVAITADIPLAAILVAAHVVVIDPRGYEHTTETIGERLSVRDFEWAPVGWHRNRRTSAVHAEGQASVRVGVRPSDHTCAAKSRDLAHRALHRSSRVPSLSPEQRRGVRDRNPNALMTTGAGSSRSRPGSVSLHGRPSTVRARACTSACTSAPFRREREALLRRQDHLRRRLDLADLHREREVERVDQETIDAALVVAIVTVLQVDRPVHIRRQVVGRPWSKLSEFVPRDEVEDRAPLQVERSNIHRHRR